MGTKESFKREQFETSSRKNKASELKWQSMIGDWQYYMRPFVFIMNILPYLKKNSNYQVAMNVKADKIIYLIQRLLNII